MKKTSTWRDTIRRMPFSTTDDKLLEKIPAVWQRMERDGIKHILQGGGNWQRGRRA